MGKKIIKNKIYIEDFGSLEIESLKIDYLRFNLKSYLNDSEISNLAVYFRRLGFSCLKDLNAVKQLSNLKSTRKNLVTWIIRKSKQTVILIFSKEVLVAIFILLSSNCIEHNFDPPSLASSEVYQSCVSKSDNLIFLRSPSRISDFILKLRGGFDEPISEEEERLIKSILAKSSESDYSEISINKFLKKLLNLIGPVISDQRLWRILSALEKPLKPQLSDGNPISSTDILKFSPMQKRVQLKMAQNNFSNNLESSGLSRNHEQLSKDIQSIEKLTRLRRAQPLYPSQVLGDSYQYGGKQLERKAPRHLPDFGISTEGKTLEEMAIEYKDLMETILSKQGLVVRKDGRLSKQEPTINIGDPETLGIVSFENNPLYEDHHFISGYPISPKAFDHFVETGEIGLSPAERKAGIDAYQREQARAEREKTTARSFYSSLPEDARIGNQQLREVEAIQERLREDPKSALTEKEKNLIQRADKYQQHRNKFYQDNPNID